ncbi:MAG: hypothetical protein KF764_26260 [Labilithrix sp.]|nr:hypothetical protein [Labilithrix sp.]
MRPLRHLVFGAVAPVVLAACPSDDGPSGSVLVVGVQSDDFGSLVGSVRVVVKKDGAILRDETLATVSGQPSPLPTEIEVTGDPGARVDVTAEALPPGSGEPVVSRLASALLPPRGTRERKLLRVHLDSRCVVLPSVPALPGTVCASPLTCIAGACLPSEVAGDALEDYEPGWAAAPPDICRPAKRGEPEVILGTGQTDYTSLVDGQVLSLEKGPQGGHHIWIAARLRNLRQSGSTTTITSSLEGDPAPVPPVSFVFTFDRDEGSYCKVWGLRYQVDAGAGDLRSAYKRFLGKRLAVTVEIADSTGAKASSTRVVQIADKLLCPDGTDACNTP